MRDAFRALGPRPAEALGCQDALPCGQRFSVLGRLLMFEVYIASPKTSRARLNDSR